MSNEETPRTPEYPKIVSRADWLSARHGRDIAATEGEEMTGGLTGGRVVNVSIGVG